MPKDFNPKFEVVSCFVEHNGDILLLHRQNHKPQGDTWGVPAGKIDANEQILDAIQREIKEETGFDISPSKISYYGKVYVRYTTYDFVYHTFHTVLSVKLIAQISLQEHKEFRWESPKNALNLPLIQDLDSCIKIFYKI